MHFEAVFKDALEGGHMEVRAFEWPVVSCGGRSNVVAKVWGGL